MILALQKKHEIHLTKVSSNTLAFKKKAPIIFPHIIFFSKRICAQYVDEKYIIESQSNAHLGTLYCKAKELILYIPEKKTKHIYVQGKEMCRYITSFRA